MNIPLLLVIAVTVGAVVFGVMTLVTGGDPGLRPTEPDSRARPLPGDRPLLEGDVGKAAFDLALRGYRMDQVDQALRRLAYDIGYKTELIQVLEAEIGALRDGRLQDAEILAQARLASLNGSRSDEPAELVPIDLAADLRPETDPAEADDSPAEEEQTDPLEVTASAPLSESSVLPSESSALPSEASALPSEASAPPSEASVPSEAESGDEPDVAEEARVVEEPAPQPARAGRRPGGGKARKTGVA
jgi:DivIVA domain-containing protein